MVTNKLLSRNEETVEVLDFRKQEIINIFKDLPVDQALLKLKENNAEEFKIETLKNIEEFMISNYPSLKDNL